MNFSLQTILQWGKLKRLLFIVALLTFLTSSFLFLTGPGGDIRQWLAQTVITTQHRSWAWIFVGAEERDRLVAKMQQDIEDAALEKQDNGLIKISKDTRKNRSVDELIKVEDISGQFWKGKKMTVYDPKTIRVMTPSHSGEGEKISSMVTRTGAVAGVNGGGFDDPEGLGNGFAAIGAVISGGDVIYTDQDGSIAQHIVGFTKNGTLVIGKYNIFELREMGISEAVSFYPRLIANGKPLITSGDGGWGRGPRTAVGQKADGTVIFIVIDGRQSHSVGATLKEVQDLFLEEGVINAGNLDGGASSELVVQGNVLTKPSSRYGERRLPSAFLVYDDPTKAVANRVWDGIDKIDAGGSYDHPDYLREQAELKAKGKLNPPTPAPTPKPETKTETKTTDPKTDTKTETDKPKTDTTKPSTTPSKEPTNSGTTSGIGEPAKPAGSGGTPSPSPTPTTTNPTPTPSPGSGNSNSTGTTPGGTGTTGSSAGAGSTGAPANGGGAAAPPPSTQAPSSSGTSGTSTAPSTKPAETPKSPTLPEVHPEIKTTN
ncbi:phosphodiester glycosidase family protein [Paenibacillus cremeus]|uniref:Phosphodiester glycosidase family protein n=1 Tax=Paenibacillus cremeus TaxID=2163881 RepID=A0A559KIC6_9BACL|nr:phosphodiester glycosidase family protein [Paenibacillus cremeus]TVY11893.1 phosphodiester glycosidase family protein [Paenibacillus cremeus]